MSRDRQEIRAPKNGVHFGNESSLPKDVLHAENFPGGLQPAKRPSELGPLVNLLEDLNQSQTNDRGRRVPIRRRIPGHLATLDASPY